jgi:hypothetical protein
MATCCYATWVDGLAVISPDVEAATLADRQYFVSGA